MQSDGQQGRREFSIPHEAEVPKVPNPSECNKSHFLNSKSHWHLILAICDPSQSIPDSEHTLGQDHINFSSFPLQKVAAVWSVAMVPKEWVHYFASYHCPTKWSDRDSTVFASTAFILGKQLFHFGNYYVGLPLPHHPGIISVSKISKTWYILPWQKSEMSGL